MLIIKWLHERMVAVVAYVMITALGRCNRLCGRKAQGTHDGAYSKYKKPQKDIVAFLGKA